MRTLFFPFLLLLSSGCSGVTVKTSSPPAGENPPPGVDTAIWKTVDALVAKLGDDDYHAREAAQKEIETLPASALEAVKASVERRSPDAEIKWRGEKAVAALADKAFWENPEFTNSIGMKLVLIPAGEFLMGSPETDKDRKVDEGPQHKVRITKPFYMGATEVTQAQWKAVMGNNPSGFKGDDLPVEQVSWADCQEFLIKLTAKEGKTYRLPTEAEWEYACRAGTTTPTGSFKPNAWGLYDMHGNVWEWCQDWFDENYYKSSSAVDPTGSAQGTYRVLRGGSLFNNSRYCRSVSRDRYVPDNRNCFCNFGFRVVMSPVQKLDHPNDSVLEHKQEPKDSSTIK